MFALGGDQAFGTLDVVQPDEIVGWAWDPDQPERYVAIALYDGDKLMAVTANLFRDGLKEAGIGNGKHAFSITTPASLKDGAPHQIYAKILGSNVQLTSSPTPFQFTQ